MNRHEEGGRLTREQTIDQHRHPLQRNGLMNFHSNVVYELIESQKDIPFSLNEAVVFVNGVAKGWYFLEEPEKRLTFRNYFPKFVQMTMVETGNKNVVDYTENWRYIPKEEIPVQVTQKAEEEHIDLDAGLAAAEWETQRKKVNDLKRKKEEDEVSFKNQASLIYKRFLLEDTDCDIVAIYVSETLVDKGAKRRPVEEKCISVEYFDAGKLQKFLAERAKGNGILQKFTRPLSTSWHIIQVVWTPFLQIIEKRRNIHAINDTGIPIASRTTTSQMAYSAEVPVKSDQEKEITRVCAYIVNYIQTRDTIKVNRMVLYFSEDSLGHLCFLWASAFEILAEASPAPQLAQKLRSQVNRIREIVQYSSGFSSVCMRDPVEEMDLIRKQREEFARKRREKLAAPTKALNESVPRVRSSPNSSILHAIEAEEFRTGRSATPPPGLRARLVPLGPSPARRSPERARTPGKEYMEHAQMEKLLYVLAQQKLKESEELSVMNYVGVPKYTAQSYKKLAKTSFRKYVESILENDQSDVPLDLTNDSLMGFFDNVLMKGVRRKQAVNSTAGGRPRSTTLHEREAHWNASPVIGVRSATPDPAVPARDKLGRVATPLARPSTTPMGGICLRCHRAKHNITHDCVLADEPWSEEQRDKARAFCSAHSAVSSDLALRMLQRSCRIVSVLGEYGSVEARAKDEFRARARHSILARVSRIQKWWRRRLALEEAKKQRAAVSIQSHFRGHKARKLVRIEKERESKIHAEQEEHRRVMELRRFASRNSSVNMKRDSVVSPVTASRLFESEMAEPSPDKRASEVGEKAIPYPSPCPQASPGEALSPSSGPSEGRSPPWGRQGTFQASHQSKVTRGLLSEQLRRKGKAAAKGRLYTSTLDMLFAAEEDEKREKLLAEHSTRQALQTSLRASTVLPGNIFEEKHSDDEESNEGNTEMEEEPIEQTSSTAQYIAIEAKYNNQLALDFIEDIVYRAYSWTLQSRNEPFRFHIPSQYGAFREDLDIMLKTFGVERDYQLEERLSLPQPVSAEGDSPKSPPKPAGEESVVIDLPIALHTLPMGASGGAPYCYSIPNYKIALTQLFAEVERFSEYVNEIFATNQTSRLQRLKELVEGGKRSFFECIIRMRQEEEQDTLQKQKWERHMDGERKKIYSQLGLNTTLLLGGASLAAALFPLKFMGTPDDE